MLCRGGLGWRRAQPTSCLSASLLVRRSPRAGVRGGSRGEATLFCLFGCDLASLKPPAEDLASPPRKRPVTVTPEGRRLGRQERRSPVSPGGAQREALGGAEPTPPLTTAKRRLVARGLGAGAGGWTRAAKEGRGRGGDDNDHGRGGDGEQRPHWHQGREPSCRGADNHCSCNNGRPRRRRRIEDVSCRGKELGRPRWRVRRARRPTGEGAQQRGALLPKGSSRVVEECEPRPLQGEREGDDISHSGGKPGNNKPPGAGSRVRPNP